MSGDRVLPFVVGRSVRGKGFYGREAHLAEILDGPRDSLWLLGTGRIGKTSLLKHTELLADGTPERGSLPLFWDLQGADSLEKLSLGQQLAKAREQLSIGAFRHNVEFFSALLERLRRAGEQGYRVDPHMLSRVEGKIEHAGLRDEMSARLLRRLPAILRETVNGGYFRFSYGWKSVAQDLLLR